MKSFLTILSAALLFAFGAQSVVGATRDMTVAFPNEGRPGVLKVVSGEGDVTITGYSGKVVVIQAEGNGESLMEESEKAKGLKRISGTRFNVSTDNDKNAVVIARPMSDDIDLNIQIPENTSVIIGGPDVRDSTVAVDRSSMAMKIIESIQITLDAQIGSILSGDVTVENIAGDMEINTFDGTVTLIDVSGAAVVNTLDGSVTAVFSKTSAGKPMAFSTIDGDVDVTLPPGSKATVTASNIDGDVYTDFDINLVNEVCSDDPQNSAMSVNPGAGNTSGKYGSRQVDYHMGGMGIPGNSITGEINGGGVKVLMKTIDGDIFIRQGK